MRRRCIDCRGRNQQPNEELRLSEYVEPHSPEDLEPVLLCGYVCDECAVVHWAYPVAG